MHQETISHVKTLATATNLASISNLNIPQEKLDALDEQNVDTVINITYPNWGQQTFEGVENLQNLTVEVLYTVGNMSERFDFISQYVNSTLINPSHPLGSSFLTSSEELKIMGVVGNYHDFTLIYRGTVDGFETSDWHGKVDGLGATLTAIQSLTGNKFGVYTDITYTTSGTNKVGNGNTFMFMFDINGNIEKLSFIGTAGSNNEI